MVKFAMDKIFNLVRMLGANGAGPSSGNNVEVNGSWLTEVLAWLANLLVQIATVVWGWLMSILYFVVKLCLNIIDILQMFVEKLVGLDVYNQEGGLSAIEGLEETDIIIRFITNDAILKAFGTICILGLLLLVVFSIIALVKQNYEAATTDGSDGVKNPREVLKKAGKGIFMCLLVPFLLIFGILGSNAVLASVCNALKGDNDLTIGGLIFTASAYEANKYREYATDGLRAPITLTSATEVVSPGDYATRVEMQELFYKLANGDVYIGSINNSQWWKTNSPNFTWASALTLQDVNTSQLVGNTYFSDFKSHFSAFYSHYFDSTPLAELGLLNEHIRSIYDTNWTRNQVLTDLTFDFSSTYITQSTTSFATTTDPRTGLPKNVEASIIVNSDSYQNYESFATIELEYYVMADLIDFAIEQNKTFYYVNASSPAIQWSDIVVDPDEPDETVNIGAYDDTFNIYRNGNIITGENVTADTGAVDGTIIASSAFAVSYYNGLTRLYWSEDGATSEEAGATYIICTRQYAENGIDYRYIPVTQTTTKFVSAFLADDYDGPIVARGVFKSEGLIPKDYCLPTAIVEQIVDDYGNELTSLEKTSPYALTDTYDASEGSTVAGFMSQFCGTMANLTGSAFATILEGVFNAVDEGVANLEKTLKEDMLDAVNEGENLLVNPNLGGFSYINDSNGNPSKVRFYDKSGRRVTAGAGATNPYTLEFKLGSGSVFGKTGYVVLQKSLIGNTVIPWYFGDQMTLENAIAQILQSTSGANMADKYTFLVASYTYDNVEVSVNNNFDTTDGVYRLLLNFDITGVAQLGREDDAIFKSTGEFIVSEHYGIFEGSGVYVEKKANLVVSGGEIFYSNGTLFFGKDDAKALYTNFTNDYFLNSLSNSIVGWINEEKSATTLSELMSKMVTNEDHKDIIDGTNEDATAQDKENVTVSQFWATDFRAGAAALISEYGAVYYSIEEEVSISGDDTITTGTIKFYNQNNQELPDETITYASSENISSNKVTQRVVVVSGADNGSAYAYATVVDSDTTNYTVGNIEQTFLSDLYNSISLTDEDLEKRAYWYYDVTFDYSFTEYKDSSGNVVAVLGLAVNDVSINYLGDKFKNQTSNMAMTTDDPGVLTKKNNGVYLGSIGGKYLLTASGTRNYIANATERSDGATPCAFSNGKGESQATIISYFKNNNVNSTTFNLKSQSEYDNIYIYFLRGDLSWRLLFDFCIHLPTISWNPFKIAFAFRCQLGISYDYAENVIYRLQGGQFYIDYNFRNSTGIGMSNLYRLSAINPFILIFSTVLTLSIIWQTVWGLIRRVYDIVLLFLMLPAVCSTMPMDEGKRFGKWKDTLLEQIFASYSVLITLNIYFILVPMVKDVTSDLITANDLPTTITGMFSTIAGGVRGLGAIFANIGGKMTNFVTSISSGINSLVGNIGFGKFLLDSDLTNAQQALLGHVNSIVYIMFFLVLTTMLKNGKKLIETVLGLEGLQDGVLKDVTDNINAVKKSPVVNAPKAVARKGAQLVGGAAKMGAKAFGSMMMKRYGINAESNMMGSGGASSGKTSVSTGSVTEPHGMDPAPSTGDSISGAVEPSTGTGTGTTIDEGTPELARITVPEGRFDDSEPIDLSTGEYTDFGFRETGGAYDTTHREFGGHSDAEIDGVITDLKDNMETDVAKVRSEKSVNVKGKLMSLDDYEDARADWDTRYGKVYDKDSELKAEKEKLQREQKFSGAAKADWDERNAKVQAEYQDLSKEKEVLDGYNHEFNDARAQEANIRATYQGEIENLESYKETRSANESAEAKLAEKAKEAGLSTDDYKKLNDLYKERDEFESMKGEIDSSFDTEEAREAARAEIDAHLDEIKNGIVDIKSKSAENADASQMAGNAAMSQNAQDASNAQTSDSASDAQNADTAESPISAASVTGGSELSIDQLKKQLEMAENDTNAQRFKSEADRQNVISSLKKEISEKEGTASESENITKPEETNLQPSDTQSEVQTKPDTTKVKVKQKPTGKKVAKNVAKGVGLATAALIVPAPVTLAVVGGVLGVKGAKLAGDKISQGLGKHPKAQKFIEKSKQAIKTGGGAGAVAGVIGTAVAGPVAGAIVAGGVIAGANARKEHAKQKTERLKREVKELKTEIEKSKKQPKEVEIKLKKELAKKEAQLKQYTEKQIKNESKKKSGVGKGVAIGTLVGGPIGGVVGGVVAARHNKKSENEQRTRQTAAQTAQNAQTSQTSTSSSTTQTSQTSQHTQTSQNSNNARTANTAQTSQTSNNAQNTSAVNNANAEFAKAVANFSNDVKDAIVDMRKDIAELKSKVGKNPTLEKKLETLQNDMQGLVSQYGASGSGEQPGKAGAENAKLSADAQKDLDAKLAELNSKMNSIKSEINSGASGVVDEKIRKSESKLRNEIDSSHSQVMSKIRDEASKLDDKISRVKAETRDAMGMAIEAKSEAKKSSQNKRTSAVHLVTQGAEGGDGNLDEMRKNINAGLKTDNPPKKQ